MTEEKQFTEAEAERHFGIHYNGKTWTLLDKTNRTAEEDAQLLDFAHASLAHWRVAGTAVHHQRGVWMLAHVYTVLGYAVLARLYAESCLALTELYRADLSDFDVAYASESMARALALAGETPAAQEFIKRAQAAGDAIRNQEDRDIFFGDFNGGNWYGAK